MLCITTASPAGIQAWSNIYIGSETHEHTRAWWKNIKDSVSLPFKLILINGKNNLPLY